MKHCTTRFLPLQKPRVRLSVCESGSPYSHVLHQPEILDLMLTTFVIELNRRFDFVRFDASNVVRFLQCRSTVFQQNEIARSFQDSVENKRASLLVVSLSKALNGTPPPLCGRLVVYPYFTGLHL